MIKKAKSGDTVKVHYIVKSTLRRISMVKRFVICLFGVMATVLLFGGAAESTEVKNEEVKMVSDGNMIKVNYTLTVDGEVIDSSKKGSPLEFKVGSKQVIAGFESAVIGMKMGEKKSFQVVPDQGYGPENPRAIQSVTKDQLPADPKPEVGMALHAKTATGQKLSGRITEIQDDIIVVDFNHPLAGKTLNFEVEIMEIN
jgi:FKBP-type peptidyl-prolyl cis-trans isomerase 2